MADSTSNLIDSLQTEGYIQDEITRSYLKQVGSSSVDHLVREPIRLKEEKDSLQRQTQDLVFANYNTFIQTAECSRKIFNQFNETEFVLQSVISELPKLKAQCQNLVKIGESTGSSLRLNERLLAQSSQLMELLELPQVMESYIRQGKFEEALELFSYVRRLATKHGNVPIIVNIAEELECSWRGMVEELLAQLRGDLPLPKCLQVMGFLRRMDIYSDAELRLKFLQTRDFYLKTQLANICVTPGESLSMKKLEVLRVQLFSVVTQYRAMFSDEDLPASGSTNEGCILYTWMTDQISLILSVVEDACAGKQGESLESVLAQTMYFGLSFSRVGLDFRGLVAVRVHKAALVAATAALRAANRKFEQDMSRYVLAPGSMIYTPPASSTDGPPFLLLEFPPLAEFTNGILRVFNELRGCAPLSIAHAFTSGLNETLTSSTKAIVNFYRQEETALGPGERATLSRFCRAYQAMLQYLGKAITLLFPASELSLHLGLPIHKIQSLDLLHLKEDSIMEPLRHLLPSQEVLIA